MIVFVAGQWMIDGVREALDAPNEYFYDQAEHKLYLIPNTTDGSPGPLASMGLVAGKLQTLISANSTMSDPITNITIQGLSFRDAADTTMEPWGVPSGGCAAKAAALCLERKRYSVGRYDGAMPAWCLQRLGPVPRGRRVLRGHGKLCGEALQLHPSRQQCIVCLRVQQAHDICR
jgi:hypothetical protein